MEILTRIFFLLLYLFGTYICWFNFYYAFGKYFIDWVFKRTKEHKNVSGIGLVGQICVFIGFGGLKPPEEIINYIALFALLTMLVDAQGFHSYLIFFSYDFIKKKIKKK